MTDEAASELIFLKMQACSLGDISTLEAVSADQDSVAVTVLGTPHQQLWLEMVKAGWADQVDLHPPKVASWGEFQPVTYKIRQEKKDSIASLIKRLLSSFSQKKSEKKSQELTDICNSFCLNFVRDLHEKVRVADGSLKDLHVIMGLTVSKLIMATIPPAKRQEALEAMFDFVQEQLRKDREKGHLRQ